METGAWKGRDGQELHAQMAPARAYTRRGIGSSGAVRNTGTRVMKSSALGELVWTLVH